MINPAMRLADPHHVVSDQPQHCGVQSLLSIKPQKVNNSAPNLHVSVPLQDTGKTSKRGLRSR